MQNFLALEEICMISGGGRLTWIPTEQIAESSSFLIAEFWPGLDQALAGFGSSGDVLSSVHWWQLSCSPLCPRADLPAGPEATALSSDSRSPQIESEQLTLKLVWDLNTCSYLHLQHRRPWAVSPFRLHTGSLSIAEVSVRSSCNRIVPNTDACADYADSTGNLHAPICMTYLCFHWSQW